MGSEPLNPEPLNPEPLNPESLHINESDLIRNFYSDVLFS
jgi:hypothetical protein